MSLDECFNHKHWAAFEAWLWSRYHQGPMFVYVDHEMWWRPFWECFLAGGAAAEAEADALLDQKPEDRP